MIVLYIFAKGVVDVAIFVESNILDPIAFAPVDADGLLRIDELHMQGGFRLTLCREEEDSSILNLIARVARRIGLDIVD